MDIKVVVIYIKKDYNKNKNKTFFRRIQICMG